MSSKGFWFPECRPGEERRQPLLPRQHTPVPTADPDTQQMQAARGLSPQAHTQYLDSPTPLPGPESGRRVGAQTTSQ